MIIKHYREATYKEIKEFHDREKWNEISLLFLDSWSKVNEQNHNEICKNDMNEYCNHQISKIWKNATPEQIWTLWNQWIEFVHSHCHYKSEDDEKEKDELERIKAFSSNEKLFEFLELFGVNLNDGSDDESTCDSSNEYEHEDHVDLKIPPSTLSPSSLSHPLSNEEKQAVNEMKQVEIESKEKLPSEHVENVSKYIINSANWIGNGVIDNSASLVNNGLDATGNFVKQKMDEIDETKRNNRLTSSSSSSTAGPIIINKELVDSPHTTGTIAILPPKKQNYNDTKSSSKQYTLEEQTDKNQIAETGPSSFKKSEGEIVTLAYINTAKRSTEAVKQWTHNARNGICDAAVTKVVDFTNHWEENKIGTKLIPNDEQRELCVSIGKVGLAGLGGAVTVAESFMKGTQTVVSKGVNVTADVVRHKYGESAGKAVEDTGKAIANVAQTVQTVATLVPVAMTVSIARKTAKEITNKKIEHELTVNNEHNTQENNQFDRIDGPSLEKDVHRVWEKAKEIEDKHHIVENTKRAAVDSLKKTVEFQKKHDIIHNVAQTITKSTDAIGKTLNNANKQQQKQYLISNSNQNNDEPSSSSNSNQNNDEPSSSTYEVASKALENMGFEQDLIQISLMQSNNDFDKALGLLLGDD